MTTRYVNPGDTIRYTPSGSAVSSGAPVVIGQLLGIPIADIADGEEGAVAVRGVYKVPAVDGAAFVKGQPIVWDVSADSGNGLADDHNATPASGDLSGGCIVMDDDFTASAGDYVAVALNVGPNTVT